MLDDSMSADDKASVGARLALLAPPCEYREVLEDLRVLLADNPSVQKKLFAATARYNTDQFIPVKLPNTNFPTLLTPLGDLGDGRFLCPRLHQSFRFDHFSMAVSNVTPLAPNDAEGGDVSAEPWRLALEQAVTEYTSEHFFASGCCSVYAPHPSPDKPRTLVACIMSQLSRHQSTGRWRSEWIVTLPEHFEKNGGTFLVHGILKVQTHLYEDGNVQLISSKEIDLSIDASSPKSFAAECVRQIRENHIAYQLAVGDNFKTMSDSTFKTLRRQLPVTRSKIDWNKIITYQIGNELSRAS